MTKRGDSILGEVAAEGVQGFRSVELQGALVTLCLEIRLRQMIYLDDTDLTLDFELDIRVLLSHDDGCS